MARNKVCYIHKNFEFETDIINSRENICKNTVILTFHYIFFNAIVQMYLGRKEKLDNN